MTPDRINEVYYGKIMKPASQEALGARIAWITQRVHGLTVLDIGCSQGIISILLARAGKKVTGIDLLKESIEYARNELALENESTLEQVTLIHGDVLRQNFEENSFDTVIMGQLIEHVPEPEAFLELSRRVCKPDGHVIITAPFGLFASPEHIHIYYMYQFTSIVSRFFILKELDIVGKRICFLGKPRKTSADGADILPVIDEQWHRRIHELSEAEFLRWEKEKHVQSLDRANKIEKMRNTIAECDIEKKEMHSKVGELADKNQNLQNRISELNSEKQVMQSKVEQIAHQNQMLQDRIAEFDIEKQAVQSKVEEFGNNSQKLQSRIEELKNEKQTLQNRIIALQNEQPAKIDKLRASPRYLIGDSLVSATQSFKGVTTLPFKLWHIYLDYAHHQKHPSGPAPAVQSQATEDRQSAINLSELKFPTKPHLEPIEEAHILFMPTNGAGLGHITRLLAIARRIKTETRVKEIIFLTTGEALSIFKQEGFVAYHYPSFERLRNNITLKEWDRGLYNISTSIITNHHINAFVFDGVSLYPGVRKVLKDDNRLHRIWVKRGMYKKGAEKQIESSGQFFQLEIIPGELGQKSITQESLRRVIIPPIVFLHRNELVSRAEVINLLELDPTKKTAFIQLGAGNINDILTSTEIIIETIEQFNNLQIVVAESIISNNTYKLPKKVRIIRNYPLAQYYNGFDMAISAGGYNTVAELAYFGIPAIFVPNLDTGSDDQYARAILAESLGTGVIVSPLSVSKLKEQLAILMDDSSSEIFRQRAVALFNSNGADVAMNILADFLLPVQPKK